MTILRFVGWAVGIIVVIAAGASVWLMMSKPVPPPVVVVPTTPTSTPPRVVSDVSYQCDSAHTVKAVFMESTMPAPVPTPDAPPTPTGSVSVVLDTAPAVVLGQAISADGARYANANESLVVWSKGSSVLVLENGKEGTYTNCIVVKAAAGSSTTVFHDGLNGFTVRYPSDFTATTSYLYTELGPKKTIAGVKFTIPTSTATGTNLSAGSYVSVEHLGTSTTQCDASAFLLPVSRVVAATTASTTATSTPTPTSATVTVGDMTYSFASSTGAAAGNRYEELVYAIPGSQPCLAVREFIHSTVLENYASGTVKAFDKTALLTKFAVVRDSLTFVPHLAPLQ